MLRDNDQSFDCEIESVNVINDKEKQEMKKIYKEEKKYNSKKNNPTLEPKSQHGKIPNTHLLTAITTRTLKLKAYLNHVVLRMLTR